jgi:hypothetical protein
LPILSLKFHFGSVAILGRQRLVGLVAEWLPSTAAHHVNVDDHCFYFTALFTASTSRRSSSSSSVLPVGSQYTRGPGPQPAHRLGAGARIADGGGAGAEAIVWQEAQPEPDDE